MTILLMRDDDHIGSESCEALPAGVSYSAILHRTTVLELLDSNST